MIVRIKHYLFSPRFHFNRFQFNLVALFFLTVGLIAGSYLTLSKIFPNVFATTSPWTQTDWSGGLGTSTTNQYSSSSSVDNTTTAGQLTLTNIEKLTNNGFENDLSSWSEVPSYTLNDQFTTDRAAGSVNGTSAEPGPGIRTVTDLSNILNIDNGFAHAFRSVDDGNGTVLSLPSITRVKGLLFASSAQDISGGQYYYSGFNTSSGFAPSTHSFALQNGGIIYTGSGNVNVASPSLIQSNVVVLRDSGAYYFVKSSTYPNWSLLWISSSGTASTLFPAFGVSRATKANVDYMRIPTATWLPTPLAYDTFTRADGTIGSSETIGPDSQTTPSLAWTGGAISGGKMVITPTLGSELVTNGDMETGNPPSSWTADGSAVLTGVADERTGGLGIQSLNVSTTTGAYQYGIINALGDWLSVSGYMKNAGSAYNTINIADANGNVRNTSAMSTASWAQAVVTGRATTINSRIRLVNGQASAARYDDISAKELTLSSLFSSVSTSDTDVISDVNVTSTKGTQAGIVTNLDSADNPANFLIAYHDGTYVKLDKNVGGTYTNLINTAATYVAGATLRVITYTSGGSLKVRVYYNNALIGTEQTISDAGIISNTKHGLFSTYSGNTFDNFTLFARGTGGEYTGAPFEELTATRDTTTKYTGTASVKLVADGTDANYLQNVNVGDTNFYNLTAYAYTDGSAVTTNDLNLYANGSTVSTTYTAVGSGWYRLSGTLTGTASAVDYGVRVKAGKTVYVDDINLNRYETLGTLDSSIFDTGYSGGAVWDTLTYVSSGSTVTVKARTSNSSSMTGATAFSSCDAIVSGSDISSNNCVTDSHRYIQYQISLSTSDVALTPTFQDISIAFEPYDEVAPTTNASAITMTRSNSGTSVLSNGWTKDDSPYFSWTAGADDSAGSGLKGYCLYLGTDPDGNPATSKGLLGTSPVSIAGTTCQFIVSSTSIDFATSSYKGNPWLSTSSSPYYLNIKAIDNARNVYTGASTQFQFRFDNIAPTNISYASCASGNFSNVADMNFNWPTTGSAGSSDDNSGIFGWQYQINSTSGTWLGTTTESALGVANYLPTSESSRILTEAQDGSSIVSGNNIVYFRAVDAAGNISSDGTIRTCNLAYGGAAPAFGGTDTVTVTPSTSTSNSYALSWPEATATNGQTVTHYYYMINTSPPSTLATLQSNATTYIDNGTARTIPTTALANVNKGTNTVYVVAIDDASTPNYSPSNYITGTFTLNSTDPDNVGNLVVSDSSIKSQSQWNVTLTWTAPTYQGAGNLTYRVYRSTDGITFSYIGSTSGLSYVDNTPSSTLYYYKIYARDGADADSSGTNAVSITPTGKWTTAPTLDSEPTVGSITTKKATITWSTSRASDSKVQYGTTSGSYDDVEPSNSSQVTSHSIQLTGLNPGTTYYYKAKWTDEDGNTGISEEKSFNTAPAPTVHDVVAKNIGLTSSIIEFTSNNASKVKIYYGTTTSFGGAKEISTSTSESTYTAELTGLADGTKYYYKINTFDSDNDEYEGTVLDFTTLPRPKISNVRIQQVSNTAQPTILVTWLTNTEVSSIVTYYPEGNSSDARDEVNVALTKDEHQMIVRGLLPQTNYVLVVKGRDKIGNEAVSDAQRLTTATDTRPPQISELYVEGTAIPPTTSTAQESTAQLIVSWNTDEPSTSQVEFGEGTGTTYSSKTQEDSNLTFNHLVIISGLTPSKVYHLRAISKDKASNTGNSIDTVTITPKATENALNLVITNLQEAFSFIGGMKK